MLVCDRRQAPLEELPVQVACKIDELLNLLKPQDLGASFQSPIRL